MMINNSVWKRRTAGGLYNMFHRSCVTCGAGLGTLSIASRLPEFLSYFTQGNTAQRVHSNEIVMSGLWHRRCCGAAASNHKVCQYIGIDSPCACCLFVGVWRSFVYLNPWSKGFFYVINVWLTQGYIMNVKRNNQFLFNWMLRTSEWCRERREIPQTQRDITE
jgi:hypothetical protein